MADRQQLAALVAELWAANAHVARERVAFLAAYVEQLAGGHQVTEERTEQAVWAAHNLRGALGSYLRPGSEQAGELEELLRDRTSVARMTELIGILSQAVSDEGNPGQP